MRKTALESLAGALLLVCPLLSVHADDTPAPESASAIRVLLAAELEKRGIVLVDPPFEIEGEYERLVDGLAKAHRRFGTGVYCVWYPIKKGAPIKEFHEALQALDIPKMLCAELHVKSDREQTGLSGTGLVIVNPPYAFTQALPPLLEALRAALAPEGHRGEIAADWLGD